VAFQRLFIGAASLAVQPFVTFGVTFQCYDWNRLFLQFIEYGILLYIRVRLVFISFLFNLCFFNFFLNKNEKKTAILGPLAEACGLFWSRIVVTNSNGTAPLPIMDGIFKNKIPYRHYENRRTSNNDYNFSSRNKAPSQQGSYHPPSSQQRNYNESPRYNNNNSNQPYQDTSNFRSYPPRK
jgi:hypothetical protein